MNDPLENLEVAKLAAALSGQLRRIDKETESSVPANRIDLRKFQQQVVNSVNPNAGRPVEFGSFQNQDEARMLEYLNREALSKVPELIPAPVYTPPTYVPPPIENIQTPVNVPLENNTVETNKEVLNKEIYNEDLIDCVKSIDDSLKQLCDFFINSDIKKNKKVQTLKKTK